MLNINVIDLLGDKNVHDLKWSDAPMMSDDERSGPLWQEFDHTS